MSGEPATLRAAEETAPAPTHDAPGIKTRLMSLLMLVGVTLGAIWVLIAIVRVFTDSWVAPINLSPDNDRVIQLNMQLTRQVAEMERVQAEVRRIDEQLAGIDGGIARLQRLQQNSQRLMQYGAEVQGEEASTTRSSLAHLRREQRVLARIRARREREVRRARANARAGLITEGALEAVQGALDATILSQTRNARAIHELTVRRQRATTQASAFQSAAGADSISRMQARVPEVVNRQEQMLRIELEMIRMRAERRGLVALKATAERNLSRLRAVLTQIRSRPLYRATHTNTDVAFIPYDQLEGVHAGSTVLRCTFAVFQCEPVGRVSRLIPGEVVTQDPWGEIARGRYAMLELSDPTGVQERILRVR